MFFRTRRSFLAVICLLLSIAPFRSSAEDSASTQAKEAEQLYSRANDYVTNIGETGYSYAYIQFYWKRAQANLDRIVRVYPDTPVGKQVVNEQVKIGPYELTYFRERVLPRLEEKKLAAFDAVNCAIFLYNLDPNRWDESRLGAQVAILEVLSRQKRWSEALAFPVLEEQKMLKLSTIFRVAARFQQEKLVDEFLANVLPDQKPQLWAIQGEAMALTGVPRDDIAKFLDEHPEDSVKLAILSGMIDREIGIQRAATLKEQVKDGIQKTHYSIMKLDVRDDVDSVAKTFFPTPNADAQRLLGKYHAAQGQKPAANASAEEHSAYLEFLGDRAKFDELIKYVDSTHLKGDVRQSAELKMIELLAEGARDADSEPLRKAYAAKGGPIADAAAIAEFRGHMNSLDARLTVREHTFSDLHIKDPCVLAQAVAEWSLTPNRSIRGAAPWDSVVQKFLPGFENLPLPKSKDVQDASSVSKPF